MSSSQKRFGQSQESTTVNHVIGFGATLFIHLLIGTGLILGSMAKAEAIREDEKLIPFTPVELIKLGDPESTSLEDANPSPEAAKKQKITKPRPKPQENKTLSKLKAEAAEPKPDQVVLRKPDKQDEKKAKRPDKKTPSAADLLKGFTHDPNKEINNKAPKGRTDGIEGGTTLNANARNRWATKVQQRVKGRWRVPRSIDPEVARTYAGRVKVSIRISEEGYIVSYNMRGRSGDPVFDASVERAVKAFMIRFGGSKLPMPDDPVIRKQVIKGGVLLTGWRYRGG